MTDIVKETTTSQGNNINPVVNTTARRESTSVVSNSEREATSSQTVEYLIYFFFGALETLLAFRLVLKLAGASISSAFVGLIYGVTGIFIIPFEGIFRRGFSQGIETTSVLEPSTLVAIIVYALLAWGIVKLLRILSGKQQPTE
jgi:hypothetical protein